MSSFPLIKCATTAKVNYIITEALVRSNCWRKSGNLWYRSGSTSANNNPDSLDIIDNFTTELVEKKKNKWTTFQTLNKQSDLKNVADNFKNNAFIVTKGLLEDVKDIQNPSLHLDYNSLSLEQKENLLQTALELNREEDFLYCLERSVKTGDILSDVTTLKCLKYLSLKGRLDEIKELADLYQAEDDSKIFKEYEQFTPFEVIAHWRKGRLNIALNLLKECYKECYSSKNESCRLLIQDIFATIVIETLNTKSEAILVCALKVGEDIHTACKDIFPITSLWRKCFVSEWYSDQSVGKELFEKYPELRHIVSERAVPICFNFLRRHNIDAVYRLIELFLKFDDNNACKHCLNLLFEYQFYHQNTKACVEIMNCSKELKISLSNEQNQKLLNLLIKSPVLILKETKTPPVKRFQYKF